MSENNKESAETIKLLDHEIYRCANALIDYKLSSDTYSKILHIMERLQYRRSDEDCHQTRDETRAKRQALVEAMSND